MANRLAHSTSPYLLQHKDNPVDWWEWGPEAFAEAKRLTKPVLLSVGYAACHWCHVMAHESFEDEATAAYDERGLRRVKVDREERPDVDAVYMDGDPGHDRSRRLAHDVFLTPDGEPFYCGTYFPPEPGTAYRPSRSSFRRLGRLADRRDEMPGGGAGSSVHLRRRDRYAAVGRGAPDGSTELGAGAAGCRIRRAARWFRRRAEVPAVDGAGVPAAPLGADRAPSRALHMADGTCEAMARGGMYDQLGGGFARYSVDAGWVVPHFEKMLYDNALLLRVYLHLWRATAIRLGPSGRARRPRTSCCATSRTAEGGFASALDADTEGVEGLTYVWTPDQLAEVLGPTTAAGRPACSRSPTRGPSSTGVDPAAAHGPGRRRSAGRRARHGCWPRGRSGPSRRGTTRWSPRGTAWPSPRWARPAPCLSDRPTWTLPAGAPELCSNATSSTAGCAERHARARSAPRWESLEDYGNLAEGLLALHQSTGEARWLTSAGELLDTALAHFADGQGGFFDTADDAEHLFTRPHNPTDNAEPSGHAALAGALLTYSALVGSTRHREAADSAVAAAGSLAAREPRFVGWTLAVAEAMAAGPLQVAVVGQGPRAQQLLRVARASTSPGLVTAHGAPDTPGIPLLADRPLMGGDAAAYVCRGFVCDQPVTTSEELAATLESRPG